MPLLKKLSTIAAKEETTIGTAETLTASEGVFNAYDIEIDAEIEVQPRESQGSFDYLSGVSGSQGGTMKFKTDAGWTGTGTPNWADVLLPACGLVEATQVFSPESAAPDAAGASVKTVTIGVFDWGGGTSNAFYRKLAGAMGNFKLIAEAGKIVEIEWEFKGVWQAPTDTTMIAPTYPTHKPFRFAGATITYNSVAQCVGSLEFDMGNEILLRECPDTTAGFKSALITGRMPKITIDPETQLVTDEDRYQDWVDNDEYAFSCAFAGAAGGSLTLAAPKAQITSITRGDRDSLLIDEIELMCNKNGANKDQDVTLTFTDVV